MARAAVLLVGLALAAAGCGAEAHAPARGGGGGGGGALVWAVGDGADGGADAKAVAQRIAAEQPGRVLYLGDVYETGTAAEFADNFASVYGTLARVTEPTPGNHEWP